MPFYDVTVTTYQNVRIKAGSRAEAKAKAKSMAEDEFDSCEVNIEAEAAYLEYRCTRNVLYAHECIGQNNVRVRQGYYISAKSREGALATMRQKFPNDWPDKSDEETFTADCTEDSGVETALTCVLHQPDIDGGPCGAQCVMAMMPR